MTIFKFYFSVRSCFRWSPTRTAFIEKTNNKLRSTVTRVGLTSLNISLFSKNNTGETVVGWVSPFQRTHLGEFGLKFFKITTGTCFFLANTTLVIYIIINIIITNERSHGPCARPISMGVVSPKSFPKKKYACFYMKFYRSPMLGITAFF